VTNRLFSTLGALRASVLGTLVISTLVACSSPGEEANAQAVGADSVVQAILGSVASTETPPSFSPRRAGQEADPLDISTIGYDRGDPQALVRVIEISDFGCGYCRRFHEETWPTLLETYVEAGLVQWKFVPFVLGMFPNGLEASLAGECGGEQDEFFTMQGRLFGDQSGWKNSADPFPFFAQLAEEEGLDVDRFNGCIEGGWRESAVRSNIRLGREIGVRGTPTFIIDGTPISGAIPLSSFMDILDIALTEKGVTPPERG
jgi:protein-disulfide isomerase